MINKLLSYRVIESFVTKCQQLQLLYHLCFLFMPQKAVDTNVSDQTEFFNKTDLSN